MAGRPIESSSEKKQDKGFYMRTEDKFNKELGRLAENENCSKADLVKRAIYEYARNHKKQ